MKKQRLVLRHKKSGKIASRKDQAIKALILEAQRLTDGGLGAGITSLLLPTSPQAKAEIDEIREIYTVCLVKPRPGKKSKTTVNKAIQTALADDELIAKLAVMYEEQMGNKPGPHTVSAKAFTHWLKNQLKKTESDAYRTVIKVAPILLEVEYSERWWADNFAERRKTQS